MNLYNTFKGLNGFKTIIGNIKDEVISSIESHFGTSGDFTVFSNVSQNNAASYMPAISINDNTIFDIFKDHTLPEMSSQTNLIHYTATGGEGYRTVSNNFQAGLNWVPYLDTLSQYYSSNVRVRYNNFKYTSGLNSGSRSITSRIFYYNKGSYVEQIYTETFKAYESQVSGHGAYHGITWTVLIPFKNNNTYEVWEVKFSGGSYLYKEDVSDPDPDPRTIIVTGDVTVSREYKISDTNSINYLLDDGSYTPPIDYQWNSLTSLTAERNGIQSTQSILGIKTSAIGDVDTVNTAGSLSNLLNPSGNNLNLSTMARDMNINEVKYVYSGACKCEITKTSATTATLEFYQANANTPFFTYTLTISDPLTSHDYLGFYIDTVNYKGSLNIISENLSTHVITYNQPSQTIENRNNFYTWLSAQPHTNPYSNNEVTTPQGGVNFGPRTTEKIEANTYPTKTGLNNGLFTAYVMTEADLQDFAEELWNENWVDNLDKKYNMPSDLFAGLYLLPFKARGNFYPNEAYQYSIKAGGVDFTAKGYTVENRYVTFNMGCIDLKPQWDSYFDYKYSKCMIYLPFIGEYELSMSDLLTKIENENGRAKIVDTSTRIKLVYKLDVLTGILIAQILINGSIVYEFSGSCSSDLPITWNTRQAAVDASINSIIGGALLVGGVVAGVATGGVGGIVAAVGAGATGIGTMAKATLNEQKQEVHSTGKMGGLIGALGVNYPYISITTPNVVTSQDQLQMKGLPSFTKAKIKEYVSDNGMIWPNSGYLNVAYIELNGYFGTEEEKKEIVDLLKGGVII